MEGDSSREMVGMVKGVSGEEETVGRKSVRDGEDGGGVCARMCVCVSGGVS